MVTGDPEDEPDRQAETHTLDLSRLFAPPAVAGQGSGEPSAEDSQEPPPEPPAGSRSRLSRRRLEMLKDGDRQIYQEFRDDGSLCLEIVYGPAGAPEVEVTYGPDGITPVCELVYNGPCPALRNSFDQSGVMVATESLGEDGKTVVSRETFDHEGRLVVRDDFSVCGRFLAQRTRVTDDETIEKLTFHRSGAVLKRKVEFEDRVIWESEHDLEGRLVCLYDGFARTDYQRGENGEIIGSISRWNDRTVHWYNAQGIEFKYETASGRQYQRTAGGGKT